MAAFSVALLAIGFSESALTKVWDFHTLPLAILFLPASILPAIGWHESKRTELRDSALTLPWVFVFAILITLVIPLSGRLGFPLRDATLVSMDSALRVNVPATMRWASDHVAAKTVLEYSYSSLVVFLLCAMILPALLGKKKAAQEFLIANALAFLMAVPMFVLLPAVGPWEGYHFHGSASQMACGHYIAALHSKTALPAKLDAAILTFPSFHVIWAILSARSLFAFRWLRIVVWPVALLVSFSTVTTGWHYYSDALAGIAVATTSIILARQFVQPILSKSLPPDAASASNTPALSAVARRLRCHSKARRWRP